MTFKSFVSKEDFTYLATYIKGKGSKTPEFRFLIQDSKGVKYVFFVVDDNHPMFGTEYTFFDERFYKTVSPTHIRFKQYNYYLLDNDPSTFKRELEKFKIGRKLFFTGRQGEFDRTYRPTFELDGVKY